MNKIFFAIMLVLLVAGSALADDAGYFTDSGGAGYFTDSDYSYQNSYYGAQDSYYTGSGGDAYYGGQESYYTGSPYGDGYYTGGAGYVTGSGYGYSAHYSSAYRTSPWYYSYSYPALLYGGSSFYYYPSYYAAYSYYPLYGVYHYGGPCCCDGFYIGYAAGGPGYRIGVSYRSEPEYEPPQPQQKFPVTASTQAASGARSTSPKLKWYKY